LIWVSFTYAQAPAERVARDQARREPAVDEAAAGGPCGERIDALGQEREREVERARTAGDAHQRVVERLAVRCAPGRRPVQERAHAVIGRGVAERHVHFGDHHVDEVDHRDLLELACRRDDRQREGGTQAGAHQNVTSSPNVGRTGNMETPERIGGELSYSKK
jgi:hypothetical protein